VSTDAGVGLGLVAGLGLLAFLTTGGVDLGPNTWAEIALLLIGVALAVAVLLGGARAPAWGGATLTLFVAVTALTAVSIAWSVQPDNSWQEASRTLSYVAAFGGAVALGRLIPERWPALIGAIAVLSTVISAYALILKVFPATLDPGETFGRLRAPFDYWNATGLMAALGLPACLWAGARRERGRALRAFCVPATGVLLTVLVLSYSRSAVLAAVVGLACWFAVVPLRLRGAAMFVLGLLGGGSISAWALATHPITHDHAALAARTTAGHSFGLVLLLVLVLMTIAGFAAAFAMDFVVLPERLRRRLGIALVTLVALVPVGAVAAMAASSRGLTGEVSHIWTTLTNPKEGVGNAPGRLVQFGNSRPLYWGEATKVGEHALLKGVGAAGYGIARTRYTTNPLIVEHAHSYVFETFADFGLIGLALNVALLVAWVLAAARAVGARTRVPRELSPERAGLLTLLSVVVVFGVHSTIDWTWFVPGTAVPALLCAGWLAGRGPLASPVGRRPQRRQLSRSPGMSAAIAGLVATAVIAAWAIWQPLHSADADAAAITALGRGDTKAALTDARAAAARDPVSVEPLWELSAIFSAIGNHQAAHDQLVKAITLQPENPATWRQLGFFDLQYHQPGKALGALRHALGLDRTSAETKQAIDQAVAELSRRQSAAGTRRP
jgi:O-Antigen ligase